jgi:hypothetical protein
MWPALFCFGLQDGASREARGRALLFFFMYCNTFTVNFFRRMKEKIETNR